MNSSENGEALPFITFNERQGFQLGKEAEEFLKSLGDTPLGAISVVGKYRTGKSFFINRVLLNKKKSGFNVGATINPCTKGLWLWNKTLESENPDHEKMKILLIDTEGFAGIDENSNHDTRIFLFALLISSYFIYNSSGNIDESALQNLSLIVNLAKEIQINSSGKDVDPEELAQYFPSFLWIVRDFALRLVDQQNNPITSKEYLENALQPQKGISDAIESKNRIRRLLKQFFRDRDCSTLIRPLENEKDIQRLDELSDDMIRADFVDQMKKIRRKIFRTVKPKILNGRALNGNMFLEIIKAYITAVNSGGVPNIENAWTYLCKQEGQKAMEDSFKYLENKLTEKKTEAPASAEELRSLKKALKEQMVSHYKQKSIGDKEDNQDVISEIEKSFTSKFKEFKKANKEKWTKQLTKWVQENSNLETRLKGEEFKNFFEFQAEIEKVKENFFKNAPEGVSKNEFWQEYLAKMYCSAAEIISRSSEENLNNQVRRLTQKLEMVENELDNRKKEHENDKSMFYEKLHEMERERAMFKAQEVNIKEKLETLKIEKEVMERNLNEMKDKYNSNHDRMYQEGQKRIKELEGSFDTLKTESYSKITEYEKKIALLEQELSFVRRDFDSTKERNVQLDDGQRRLLDELRSKETRIEELKRRITEVETSYNAQITQIKNDYEAKLSDLHNELEKSKNGLKVQGEWLNEKMNLNNQISFLKSQLEENKRLHDALILALEQGINNNENENTNELVETNKNLSAAMDKIELRCKALEEKNEKLKLYKRMVKSAKSIQCNYCSKHIGCQIFLAHIGECANHIVKPANETIILSSSKTQLDKYFDHTLLQVSINQTMVKESTDSKPYTEYLIQVVYEGKKWSVSRKYKSFCELHQYLTAEFQTVKFPDSSYVIQAAVSGANLMANSKRPTVIEERRKALQQYLRDLGQIEKIANSSLFQDFLEITRNIDCDSRRMEKVPSQNYLSRQSSYNDSNIMSNQFRKNKENMKYTPDKAEYDQRRYGNSSSRKNLDEDSNIFNKFENQPSPNGGKSWYEKSNSSSTRQRKSIEGEPEPRRIEFDVSNISSNMDNQEYVIQDVSHNSSLLHHLKHENQYNSNIQANLGLSSPFKYPTTNEKTFTSFLASKNIKASNESNMNNLLQKAPHLRYGSHQNPFDN